MPTQERLQKILAAAGLGSRRACEELIRAGRVAVNGRVAELGQKADPARDRITLDGAPLALPRWAKTGTRSGDRGAGKRLGANGAPVRIETAHTYIALYKPVGVVSTARDPEGRQTVVDLVPSEARLYPVGRLDMLSEGLVLLTDDGELALRLTHPRYGHTKEYRIRLSGRVTDEAVARWQQGVLLDDGKTAPADVAILRHQAHSTWLRVVLHEGRNREIRRVAELLGYSVQQLIRVRIGPVHLGQMKPGEWRHLTGKEMAELGKIKKAPAARGLQSEF